MGVSVEAIGSGDAIRLIPKTCCVSLGAEARAYGYLARACGASGT